MQLDLADLASVKKFSKAYLAEERGPDLLILNAGVMACPQSYTKDGFEMQIGAHAFLLSACCQTTSTAWSSVRVRQSRSMMWLVQAPITLDTLL